MQTRETFGAKVSKARNRKGLTQAQLSEMADITQNNLSRIERGLYSPGIDILLRIADALDMELDFVE